MLQREHCDTSMAELKDCSLHCWGPIQQFDVVQGEFVQILHSEGCHCKTVHNVTGTLQMLAS